MANKYMKTIIADETGATAVEYGVIAMLIAVAIAGVVTQLGSEVETQYETVSTEYSDANAASNGGA